MEIGSKYIRIGQDGNRVSNSIKKSFSLVQGLDTRFKKKSIEFEVFDVVGLICKTDEILVVFPKHFFTSEEILKIDLGEFIPEIELKLLFQAIYKYITNQKTKASKYVGNLKEFDSDYPFSAFFSIYNYFQQFGIYKEKTTRTKQGYSGRVSWKETIRKSNKVYSSGNIIHFPLFVKQNKSKEVFISECMAFAIDYTLDRFSFLFTKKKTGFKQSNFDFFNNLDYVIKYLNTIKNEVFKDVNKKLVNDLIEFYLDLLNSNQSKGGDIHVKIKYFNLIWEDMVENYLNRHFVRVDAGTLVFDTEQQDSIVTFSKKTFKVDDSHNKHSIEPDHYFVNQKEQFIFDAKYYINLSSLNYKQYAYHEMLKLDGINTVSALIIPSENENDSELHFSLAQKFTRENDSKTQILLHKLKIKDVMKTYVI